MGFASYNNSRYCQYEDVTRECITGTCEPREKTPVQEDTKVTKEKNNRKKEATTATTVAATSVAVTSATSVATSAATGAAVSNAGKLEHNSG